MSIRPSRLSFTSDGIGHQLSDRTLSVPEYQRSYSWELRQIDEFWSDLKKSFAGGSGEYFLGAIVLTRGEERGSDSIIDGQQRLATTALLLAAIRDVYREKGDRNRAGILQSTYLSRSDLKSGEEHSRLSLNGEDGAYFRKRVILGCTAAEVAAPLKSHQLLSAALDALTERVRKETEEAGPNWPGRLYDWTEFLGKRVLVIVVEVPSESDAFTIFETLNDRGADLTIADLLKNYLLGRAGNQVDAVRSCWLRALGSLEIAAETATFTTFLRHFWSSKHGAVRERDLYRSIKDRVSTETNAVDFAEDLLSSAGLYAAILNSDNDFWSPHGTDGKRSIERLIALDLEQYRPLLMAAMQHFEAEELKRLLGAMLNWLVRGLVVGGIGGGAAESAFCEAAVKIRAGAVRRVGGVFELVSGIVPSDEEFKTAFATAKISKGAFARYLLLELEASLPRGDENEFVPNPNENSVNLEHVLPRNASDGEWGSFSADQKRDYVARIGNLALLSKGANGRIGF